MTKNKIILLSFVAIVFSITLYFKKPSNHNTDNLNSKDGYVNVHKGKLYYQTVGSSGTPMIVVHGGPGLNQDYLLPEMASLSKNYQVTFYDQRGSGKSLDAEIDEQTVNAEQFAQDLEDLRKSLNYDKFILIGHSWGGRLAMEYAIRYSENIEKLILSNSTPATYKGIQAFTENILNRTHPFKDIIAPMFNLDELAKLKKEGISELYAKLFAVYFYDPENVKKLNLSFDLKSAYSGFKVFNLMNKTTLLKKEADVIDKLHDLKIPTLVIHGDADVIPEWTAKEIADSISNSDFKIIKNCGHFPYVEKSEEYFKLITEFLKK